MKKPRANENIEANGAEDLDRSLDDFEEDQDIEEAEELLPAWFVRRMMGDTWRFGLLLVTRQVLVIETIRRVTKAADGTIWLDVSMHNEGIVDALGKAPYVFAPTSRCEASVNAAHVVAALDLQDT